MFSSLVAGVLADWFGRKTMMIVSALMFVASVALIVISQGFLPLFLGRLLQGMSGGVIAVVVPLYLAECLSAKIRGKGTAMFQFMLTFGIVVAALLGLYYTRGAESAIAAAAGNEELIKAAQNHAWRGMFWSVIYPGLIFFLGAFFVSESPRWLFRRGKKDQALAALRRSCSEEEAQLEMSEMESMAHETPQKTVSGATDSLLQRKYVIPFIIACVILACNQATGINSILGFLVVILQQAGMSASLATQGDVAVKVLNCVMTLVAVAGRQEGPQVFAQGRDGRHHHRVGGSGPYLLQLRIQACGRKRQSASRNERRRAEYTCKRSDTWPRGGRTSDGADCSLFLRCWR